MEVSAEELTLLEGGPIEVEETEERSGWACCSLFKPFKKVVLLGFCGVKPLIKGVVWVFGG